MKSSQVIDRLQSIATSKPNGGHAHSHAYILFMTALTSAQRDATARFMEVQRHIVAWRVHDMSREWMRHEHSQTLAQYMNGRSFGRVLPDGRIEHTLLNALFVEGKLFAVPGYASFQLRRDGGHMLITCYNESS